MNKEDFLDRLNRAYLMEEEMADELINLSQSGSLPDGLTAGEWKRVKGILLSIKSDTLRHKEIVLKIKETLA
jgi:hypothetical protein